MAVYDDLINGYNPISWWKLDETTGTTLVDQTSFKNLTIADTYTLNVSSGAHAGVGAGIDYADAYATTTVSAGDYTPTAMTVIAWVNLDAVNIDFASIISRTNTSGSTSAMGWGIAFDDVDGVFFKVKDTTATGGTADFLATWATPPTGALTMIIGEWAANGPTRIYSNGDNLQGTSTDTNITEVIDNESNILLGGAPDSTTRRVDGKIFDVVVLPVVLTGAQKDELYAAGRSSVNLGLASETDTALPLAVPIGVATETDTALSVARGKDVNMGLATETDTALAVTGAKLAALGLATETDTALAVAGAKLAALGLATETDTALAAAPDRALSLGLAAEVDSVPPLAKPIGLATETDTALAITSDRIVALGLATETDTALALAAARFIDLGLATEADTAPGMTIDRALSLGLATETDTALNVAVLIARTIQLGLAQEASTALRLDFGIEPFKFLLYEQMTVGGQRAPRKLRPVVWTDRTNGKKYIIMHDGAGLAELQEFAPKFSDVVFSAYNEPTLLAGKVIVRVYVENGVLKAERYAFDVRNRPLLFGRVARPRPDEPVYRLILDEQDVDWEN